MTDRELEKTERNRRTQAYCECTVTVIPGVDHMSDEAVIYNIRAMAHHAGQVEGAKAERERIWEAIEKTINEGAIQIISETSVLKRVIFEGEG